MMRLVAIVVLLVVIYASTGVAVYLNDVARDWCNLDFSFYELFWRALFWPARLYYAATYCD